MKRFLIIMFFLIAIYSCKEVFEAPPQSMIQATFLNSETEKTITSKVTALGLGLDSLWAYETSISEIVLPLSAKDTTSYIISFDSQIDTITFLHETFQKYDSMESGFYYEYKLDSIIFSRTRIDSIQITDSLITKTWHENIKLYIRPLPAGSN